MSALSSLTAQPRAALMPAPLSNAPSAGTGVLANRLAERLGVSPSSLQAPTEQFTPTRVAERVLGFIEQRLQREAADGADQEKLQGLLQQAREGIEQGFAEARKILDGLGVLQGKIATDIDETYARLQDGLQGLQARTLPAGQGVAVLLAVWLARSLLPLLFYCTPYVRAEGLGAALSRHLPRQTVPYLLAVQAGLCLLFGWAGVYALLAALGCFYLARRAMLQRLGGCTGDCAGALVELAELAILLVLALALG